MIHKIAILLAIMVIVASAQETGARYLVITHDNFYEAVQPLAEWKHKKGMKTKVVKLSQIGSTSSAIKNYVANAYNTWSIPPQYLLLVGAPNYLPFPTVSGWYSDNYYTNITGDIYNEILSGRLTVHNTTEAQTVVNKILAYERNPHRIDSLWFKKACLIVNRDYDQDDSIYFSDAHHAAGLMIDAGFIEIDTLSDGFGHNANTVVNRVNSGRSIVMYRGQGLNNWSWPFGVNPDVTQNGSRLPIVLSITCRTIGTGSSPATAERWLLTGTPASLRGAAGYFAGTTSGSNIAHLRSAIAKGFHDSLFLGSVKTFGAACEGGRIKAYTMYPYAGGASEYRGYTTIGDPEMNIWTDTPCSLLVTHPASIPIVETSFNVNVSQFNTSVPLGGAVVCLMGEEDSTIYVVDTTDQNGNAYFEIDPQFADDTIHVTVTGRNLLPYEGFMTTSVSGIYVSYFASIIDDTQGGNGDNHLNPGEEINLHMWVKNYGADTAIAVQGVLRTDDPYVLITDSVRAFGTMAPGQICSTGINGYAFSTMINVPDGHVVNFELDCHDVHDSSWVSYFSETVFAPILTFHDYAVSGGNGNNSLEPGEVVGLAVTLKNDGSAAAESVHATLHCQSDMISVLDSTGYYPIIEPGSMATNNADSFVLAADSNAIPGTIMHFTMMVNATFCTDTINFLLTINTGIEETAVVGSIKAEVMDIYPNPCHGMLQIRLNRSALTGDNNTLHIYDASGLLVREYSLDRNSDIITWPGDDCQGNQLPGGVYFIKFTTSQETDRTYKAILIQ
jgi:hypothetical protein